MPRAKPSRTKRLGALFATALVITAALMVGKPAWRLLTLRVAVDESRWGVHVFVAKRWEKDKGEFIGHGRYVRYDLYELLLYEEGYRRDDEAWLLTRFRAEGRVVDQEVSDESGESSQREWPPWWNGIVDRDPVPDGTRRTYWDNGQLRSEATWLNGERTSWVKRWNRDGNFVNSEGRLVLPPVALGDPEEKHPGSVYTDSFRPPIAVSVLDAGEWPPNWKLNGPEKQRFEGSKMIQWSGNYNDGKKHGVFTYWWSDGEITHQELWVNDLCTKRNSEPPWWDDARDQIPDLCVGCMEKEHDDCAVTISSYKAEHPCTCSCRESAPSKESGGKEDRR